MRHLLPLLPFLPFALTGCGSDADTGGALPQDLDCNQSSSTEATPTATKLASYTTDVWRFLQADDTHVYWTVPTDETTTLERVEKSGGTPTVVAEVEGFALGSAQDATNVYVRTFDVIARIAKSDGALTVLLDKFGGDDGIAVDDKFVYAAFDTSLCTGKFKGKIIAVDKQTGQAVTLVDGLDCTGNLVSDGAYVYFTRGPLENRSLQRIARAGGKPETLATSTYASGDLALSDAHVYFARNNEPDLLASTYFTVMKVPKTGGAVEPLTGGCEWGLGLQTGEDGVYYVDDYTGYMRLDFAGALHNIDAPKPVNATAGEFTIHGKTIYQLENLATDNMRALWAVERP